LFSGESISFIYRQSENTSHFVDRNHLKLTRRVAWYANCSLSYPANPRKVAEGGKPMKLGLQLALLTALLTGIAIVGPGFCLPQSTAMRSPEVNLIRRSVVKVHTDHGVITLPGSADTWDAAENAVFVADSIADVQVVNNEVPWRISAE
jgi:hypothetical protein